MKNNLKFPPSPQLVALEGKLRHEQETQGWQGRMRYPYLDQQGKPIQARVSSIAKARGALSEINRLYRHARLGMLPTDEAARLAAVIKVANDTRDATVIEDRIANLELQLSRIAQRLGVAK